MVAFDPMPDLHPASENTESAGPYAHDPVFQLHVGGKMEIASTVALTGPEELSMAYTPGVARVCEAIADDPQLYGDYTWTANTVAVVTDGTAVLGLGDIGPRAAMPVMEGKAVLFKQFGGIDAIPICLTPPIPTRSSRPSCGWPPASVASTSRTSPHLAASTSRSS
jgi:malate dehydrogenase (oxaloacetate-decarboxylating)